MIGTVLTGGLGIIAARRRAGDRCGATLGHFFKKSLHLTPEEIEQIGKRLDGGQVGVVVNCDEDEIDNVSEYMGGSEGHVLVYRVPTEALKDAAAAVTDNVTSDDPGK